ncbi:hypothetical protein ACG2LH_13295 [Zhouia sp. PK063]|uniref:hypothetical protein n=1 Tax=Zhouia sp. PK063 TaxID=3373602 RepID=UPI0037B8E374
MQIPECSSHNSGDTGNFTLIGSDGNTYTITWQIISKSTGSGSSTVTVLDGIESYFYQSGNLYFKNPTYHSETIATYPVKPERLQVKYSFLPTLPYKPDGFGLTAYNPNLSGSNTTAFSLNYTDVSQSSITINITRTDISSGENGSCWSGNYYFDMMMFKYQS